MHAVSRRQVRKLMAGDAYIVDVLPQQSFRRGHLPGAINVPFDERFDERVLQALPDQNNPVIVYCADAACDLSPQAAEHLVSLGYTKVFDYAAGKADWQDAGLPMEQG
jgi:rhodanese-related sulfurtransferase